ncbi:MAG TPA: hypothetical protein VGP18_13120 [Solirubrobacteraceae bacterium]|nr:hypothetical protein [Solirubrobacteraceae bacterium]
MRVRSLLFGTVACAFTVAYVAMALAAPAAQAAGFGVERFVAANCIAGHENCVEELFKGAYPLPKEPTVEEAKAVGYTQAGGHPSYGITAFKVNTEGEFPNAVPAGLLTGGPVTHIRTDVAPGVSTNPTTVASCSMKQFDSNDEEKEAIAGTGFYPAPSCSANTEIGVNRVVVAALVEPVHDIFEDVPLAGKVYNLVQPFGLSSDFGVALELPQPLTEAFLKQAFAEHPIGDPTLEKELEEGHYFAHTLIEGHVEWAGDYHDYYEINTSPTLPLISSILTLRGNIGEEGKGGFITNPSNCAPPGPATTNTVTLQSQAGQKAERIYTTPIGTEGCLGGTSLTVPPFAFKAPPFAPTFSVKPATTQSDQPDGITTELAVPHDPSPTGIDSSQLKNATIVMPEGMTLNPSAATGLKTCSEAQIGIKTRNPVTCPAESRLGSVTLKVPDLPESEPLKGHLFLGGAEPLKGSPYTVYLEAESARYGVSVRVQGTVETNESTGRVTAKFLNTPEQPFSNVKIVFKEGALAPIANSLSCGAATVETSLVPYTATATQSPFSTFLVDSNGSGGACASPLPFALTQSTTSQPATGGAPTSFTFNLARADGQQYLSHVTTALPLGLVGKIASVPLCPEPQASTGVGCPSESQIGTATTTVGSGSAPVQFSGPVYLTGPTNGAPYGMTTVINAAIGPFSLGNVVVRSKIEVNPYTSQVTVSSEVPTIFKGIPLRMKTLSLTINGQGFLVNPTSCAAQTTTTTLTSSGGATQSLSTPFQATNCSALAFAPKFGASSGAKTSRANGASLVTNVNVPAGGANFKSVLVTVPKQLPSRLSTLKNACLEATFNSNPSLCPANSKVGTARIKTPVLPGQLSGPAYFVSHGGAAFPDLDLVLTGDNVTVILVGNTNIAKGVTTTNFASTPDVPFTGFELNLPTGPNSAVAANGNLCKQSLVMPTTITAQNGKVFKQNTKINVTGCPVTVVSHAAKKGKAVVVVRVPEAGRVSGGGSNLKTVYKNPAKQQNVTLEVPVTSSRRPLSVKVRVGFTPKAKGKKTSTAFATVILK